MKKDVLIKELEDLADEIRSASIRLSPWVTGVSPWAAQLRRIIDRIEKDGVSE